MIPRLGDGNYVQVTLYTGFLLRLENDSPSRGRKQSIIIKRFLNLPNRLENDSPSRGRKLCQSNSNLETGWEV